MYLQEKHCRKIVSELSGLMYSKQIELNDIWMIKGDSDEKIKLPVDRSEYTKYTPGDSWGDDDETYLFRTSFEIPEDLAGKYLLLMVETAEYGEMDPFSPMPSTKWNMTRNPQFLLYLNGRTVQGLDKFHTYAVMTRDAKPGEVIDIALDGYPGSRLMVGREGRVQLYLKAVVLERQVESLYYHLKVLLDAAERNENDKMKADQLAFAENAVNMLDLRKPYSPEFTDSVIRAYEYLENDFYNEYCGETQSTVSGIGHTHIDVAWLWPLDITRMKTIHSFSTVLELMDHYPEYLFMSSQPQLYDFIKKQRPDILERIKEKVEEGVWEPEGGMWLEADCNVTGGESFVRQLLFGTRFFREEFGTECRVLWLPDVFGYSAALPQILRKSGIDYFMTTKIFWNEYNRFPYETFEWEGMDGSSVLTHFITATDTQSSKSYGSTYNGRLSTPHVKGSWENYTQKELNDDVLMSFGYGDGGGGPTREMLEEGRRLARGIPGCPRYEMKKSRDFFEQLDERVSDNKRLPKWVGELYLELHRGTYTSVGKNKWYNRKLEMLLREVELFSLMASTSNLALYPQQDINDSWETVLLNQFHDILPGSSIMEVYQESQAQYAEVMDRMNERLLEALQRIAHSAVSGDDKCVVFNQLSFERYDIAKVQTDKEYTHALGKDGNKIPGQMIEEEGQGYFIFVAKTPSMGYSVFDLICEKPEESSICVSENGMENDFVRIEFDGNMHLVSIFDKCNERELVEAGQKANEVIAFEDKPYSWDAWDVSIYYNDKSWSVDDVESVEVIETGPVRAGIKIRRSFLDSVIEQKIYMYSFSPRIDFDTYIDWKNDHILLKAAFPMDIHAEKATYEIQYGNVERPTHWNTSWDYARFEVCAHKWADISEADYGVSLMNDCKYGHDIKGSVMRLTLLKSATRPSPVADYGEHYMTYSIMPHSGDFRRGGTVEQAYSLNNPLRAVVPSGGVNILGDSCSFVSVDSDNVVVEAVKKAEDSDDIIVRLYECHNKRTRAAMKLGSSIKECAECNLLEQDEMSSEFKDNEVTFDIKPFEIKTFKIKLK